MKQMVLTPNNNYASMDEYLRSGCVKRLMLVCGSSISKTGLDNYFKQLESRLGIKTLRFSDFAPNSSYDPVAEGVRE